MFQGLIPLIFLFIFLSIIIYQNYHKHIWPSWKLRKITSTPIRMIKAGEYVKVIGKVVALHDPMISPVTGRPCLFYRVMIVEKEGKSGYSTILDKKGGSPFLVEDNTGLLYVDPKNYTNQIRFDQHFESGSFSNPSSQFQKYLSHVNIKSTNFVGLNRALTCREGILVQDVVIAAAGYATWTTAEALQLPLEYAGKKILVLSAKQQGPYWGNTDAALRDKPLLLHELAGKSIQSMFDGSKG